MTHFDAIPFAFIVFPNCINPLCGDRAPFAPS